MMLALATTAAAALQFSSHDGALYAGDTHLLLKGTNWCKRVSPTECGTITLTLL
jgi:hypothetical protein